MFVMHADFVRVVAGQKLTAHVPLHFTNQETSVGVKMQGGEVSHTAVEVEVSCLPSDLPEFIEVNMAKVEIGTILHLSDLVLPAGVQLVALAHGKDLPVANIHASRVVKDAE
jgi:large subunit ribosomal protein L25